MVPRKMNVLDTLLPHSMTFANKALGGIPYLPTLQKRLTWGPTSKLLGGKRLSHLNGSSPESCGQRRCGALIGSSGIVKSQRCDHVHRFRRKLAMFTIEQSVNILHLGGVILDKRDIHFQSKKIGTGSIPKVCVIRWVLKRLFFVSLESVYGRGTRFSLI